MNSLSFRTIRMGHPNPTVEFFWPVGKEVPQDVRKLTVSEFHLAVQLAAKCIRDVRDVKETKETKEIPEGDSEYKLKYESLLQNLHTLFDKDLGYAELKTTVEEQLKEVHGEIAILKELLQPQVQPEPQPEVKPEVEAEPPQPKRKRGRPRKL